MPVAPALTSEREVVPTIDQPNFNLLPSFASFFAPSTGSFGPPTSTAWQPSVAVGGDRVYVGSEFTNRIYAFHADTRAFAGEAASNGIRALAYYRNEIFSVVQPTSEVSAVEVSSADTLTPKRRLMVPPLDLLGEHVRMVGVAVAWNEVWLTFKAKDVPGTWVSDAFVTGVLVLDATTGAAKRVTWAAPRTACTLNLSQMFHNGWQDCARHLASANGTEIAAVPEVDGLFHGCRFLHRDVLASVGTSSEPLVTDLLASQDCVGRFDQVSLYDDSVGDLEGLGSVWGMRWVLATNLARGGSDGWYVREFAVETVPSAATPDSQYDLVQRRSWQPKDSTSEARLDIAYGKRDVRIDWSGQLTHGRWMRGTRCVDYRVSDADLYVVGARGQHWLEPARNLVRVDLEVDGQVKSSSTAPFGAMCLDTDAISNGPHELELIAYLASGASVKATNPTLRIDHDGPTGALEELPAFVTGPVLVRGRMEDLHSGPATWQPQRSPQGQGSWDPLCSPQSAPDVGTAAYSCSWDTRTLSDGRYDLRALMRDQVEPAYGGPNSTTTPVRTVGVDNTRPNVAVSGFLRDAADTRPLHDGNRYWLDIAAEDATSGVRSVEVLVDGIRRDFVEQACPAGGCQLVRTFFFDPADYGEDAHIVEVRVTDGVGHQISTQWTVYVEKIAPQPTEGSSQSTNATGAALGPSVAGGASPTMPAVELPALPGFRTANPSDYLLPCTSDDHPANFPVWSLGSSFEGEPLTAVVRRCDVPSPMEPIRSNWVTYIYGDCPDPVDDPDRDGCVPPLQVQSWPACESSIWSFELGPEEFRIPYVEGEIRGAPSAVFGPDGLRVEIYTGVSTVVIFGVGRDQVLRAAAAVREELGAGTPNSAVPALPGSELPPAADGALKGVLPCGVVKDWE